MAVEVADNPERGRYEALVDGEVAGASYYRERDGVRVLTHTEVADEYEGQGVGGRLVAGALDDIRARGLRVQPVCNFTAAFIDRHPEYEDLVTTPGPAPPAEPGDRDDVPNAGDRP